MFTSYADSVWSIAYKEHALGMHQVNPVNGGCWECERAAADYWILKENEQKRDAAFFASSPKWMVPALKIGAVLVTVWWVVSWLAN